MGKSKRRRFRTIFYTKLGFKPNGASTELSFLVGEEKAADIMLSEISDSINIDAADEEEQEIETPVTTIIK